MGGLSVVITFFSGYHDDEDAGVCWFDMYAPG
jgi:hypothetical protein